MIIMQKVMKIRKHMIIHTGISIREPLQLQSKRIIRMFKDFIGM